ncbi:DUF4178 domain-containing protein [Pelagimonas varians]|uniref:DUF4178 domain-containing protein n=1 Tax=Pelagimonas varians TaxID=696760 RepID=A0A238K1F0_9RHOB|nr:DUF4178 domain-containing protein [Pelagimonas varians]PYG33269.1 uncharacterized protein DUF4178 [Pelagimonas varians]SMX36184.1 hypothetical protein PEV8663_00727 [Pelagimonas varians]
MTRASDLKTVNCTSCGAGLDVLGGGRVTVHICPYCGTELDAQDSYKALRTFADLKRPDTPFTLGMKGLIQGVEYTVIGTLEHTETYNGRKWVWVDHQMYSPTHGYAFLTLEDGFVTFSRRYRHPGWLSENQVERAEVKPRLMVGGESYVYYATSTSAVTYAEGEFTWNPAIGDKSTSVSVLGDTSMLDFSQSGTERETYRSSFFPRAEVEASFGIKLPKLTKKVHPLQPFKGGKNFAFIRNWSAGIAGFCLILSMVFGMSSGDPVLNEIGMPVVGLPVEIPFEVTKPDQLVEIAIAADVKNSWASIGLEVTGPNDEVLFEAGRTVEAYHGRDSEGSWSEGSGRANLRFVPQTAGTYKVTLGDAESGVWSDGTAATPKVAVSRLDLRIREGQMSGVGLGFLAVVFGLLAGWQFLRKLRHSNGRWRGSDWTDED